MKFRNLSKDPTYGKIGASKLYSRIKLLIAGGLMTFSALILPSFKELAIILAFSSAGFFAWDIFGQTKSAITTEKRISDLEKTVKEQSDKIQKLESDSKSGNQ